MVKRKKSSGLIPVVISGGGITGLIAALSLHQIGVRCVVVEAARTLRACGGGLSLEPLAVRELLDLGFRLQALRKISAPITHMSTLGPNGAAHYNEPRGIAAGYRWPSLCVDRGALHTLLAKTFIARAGADALMLGHQVTGYAHADDGVLLRLIRADARVTDRRARVMLAAEGIHSSTREQMIPDAPAIHWAKAISWRGLARTALPVPDDGGVVFGDGLARWSVLPASARDPKTGLVTFSWMVEKPVAPRRGWEQSGWFKPVSVCDFRNEFSDLPRAPIDMAALIDATDTVFEAPMIDRPPLPRWVDDRVALLGDAAHHMMPRGATGPSQSVIGARVLAAMILQHGVGPSALAAYETARRAELANLQIMNRTSRLHTILDAQGAAPNPAKDGAAAALPSRAEINRLNTSPATIPPGARLGSTGRASP